MIVEKEKNEAVSTPRWRDLLNKRDALNSLIRKNGYDLFRGTTLFFDDVTLCLHIATKSNNDTRDILHLLEQNNIEVSEIGESLDHAGTVVTVCTDEDVSPFFRTEAQQQEAEQEARTREAFNKDMMPFADSLAHFIMSKGIEKVVDKDVSSNHGTTCAHVQFECGLLTFNKVVEECLAARLVITHIYNKQDEANVYGITADISSPYFRGIVDTRFMTRAMLCARQLKDDISRKDWPCVLEDAEVHYGFANNSTLKVSFRGKPTCFDLCLKMFIRKGYILCPGTHVNDGCDCTVIISCDSPAFDNLGDKTNRAVIAQQEASK